MGATLLFGLMKAFNLDLSQMTIALIAITLPCSDGTILCQSVVVM